jgi:hypothetical protein
MATPGTVGLKAKVTAALARLTRAVSVQVWPADREQPEELLAEAPKEMVCPWRAAADAQNNSSRKTLGKDRWRRTSIPLS